MPGAKFITLPGNTWQAGATWFTMPDSGASQTVIDGDTLYTGDVVVLGTAFGTEPDPAALGVTSTTTVSDVYVVGVVGGETNMAFAGGPIPEQDAPHRFDACTTASSTTVTDVHCLASDVGKGVVGPGIPVGAYIVSVTPSTSFVMNVAATASASVTLDIGPRTSSVGPGWLGVPAGEVTPVVIGGWAYINVGSNTITAGSVLTTSATARVADVQPTESTVAGLQSIAGSSIAVTLEDYNGAGVITSGDGSASVLVRAWISKF